MLMKVGSTNAIQKEYFICYTNVGIKKFIEVAKGVVATETAR